MIDLAGDIVLAVLALVILWQQRKLFKNQKQLLKNDKELYKLQTGHEWEERHD